MNAYGMSLSLSDLSDLSTALEKIAATGVEVASFHVAGHVVYLKHGDDGPRICVIQKGRGVNE